MPKRIRSLAVLAVSASFYCFAVQAADPDYYSKTNVLTGATQVAPSVNYGKGIVFGNLDTGIVPWIGFSSAYNGQGIDNIDTINSASCLNGSCTAGLFNTDQHGHGTFTASQIVGAVVNFDGNGNGISSVAAGGRVISVQVLNAQGSGTNLDIANGIRYAVDKGAQVLNLSLGPGGSSKQQAAFYNSMASAINYAASKNVYVVFAGGNNSQNLVGGQKITGFTDAAIQRLLFVGSTDSKLKISSFSNKPGSGNFVSTTGKSVFYKNMWVMADGGNANFFGITDPVYGASNSNTGTCAGYDCITQKVGTSMAAPQATGSIGLLLAKWPVLITNGNAAKLLEQTAKDLGSSGVDTTYGTGFINLLAAFQPQGSLTASTSSGQQVTVSSGGTSTISGGALGSMPGIASVLRNYTVFDEFQRDFSMDLSGLVSTRPFVSSASLALSAPRTSVSNVRFTDGNRLAFGSMEKDRFNAVDRPQGSVAPESHFVSFTSVDGSSVAAGTGNFPAAASFAEALWGAGSLQSGQAYNLGASQSLLNLSGGGHFFAYGSPVASATRVAFTLSETADATGFDNSAWSQADTRSFGAGITHQIADGWTGGITMGLLNEQNGLLGTRYSDSGAVRFNDRNRSVSLGVTSSYDLGETTTLLLDAAIARSEGKSFDNSLVSGVSPLYAYSLGASLVQRDAFAKGDGLSFSVRAPLRVYSGTASIATTAVDEFGVATTGSQRISLTPDGRELALTAAYESRMDDGLSWNISANARRDAENIAGLNEANVLLRTRLSF